MSEYKMPKLGADMEDAILLEWKVKVGDQVRKGDIIAEIETVKGDIDVEVFENGIVEKIIAQPGEQLPVGTVLAYINNNRSELSAGEPEELPPAEDPPPAPVPEEIPPEKIPPTVPKPVEWPPAKEPPTKYPPEGDPSKEEPVIIPIPPVEIPLPEEPPIPARPDDIPPLEEPWVPKPEEIPTPLRPDPAEPGLPGITKPRDRSFRHKASPLARTIARDLGIDLEKVRGTGEGGIIHKIDVEYFAQSQQKSNADISEDRKSSTLVKEKPGVSKIIKPDRTVKMRSAIAAAMSRSNSEIPHYYLETTIDMSTALAWLKEENRTRAVHQRVLAAILLLRATALALKKVPALNGYWVKNQHQPKAEINIGFAIALRTGGVVIPAIHVVDKKSLPELMEQLNDVTTRAREGHLRSSELSDGTITITNIGDRGVEKIFGVIYPPQLAIVGFGKIMNKPWADNGMLGVRPILTATLAADHRATDGRIGAKFLATLNEYLQQPALLNS